MWYGTFKKSYILTINFWDNSTILIIRFPKKTGAFNIVNGYYIALSCLVGCSVIFKKNLNSLIIASSSRSHVYFIKNAYYNLMSILFKFFFKKFKFQGKGYYVYKNKRNSLAFQFNYSHKINFYNYNSLMSNFSKRSWLLSSFNTNDLISRVNSIIRLRSINIFTNRGVRFHKQLLCLKKKKKLVW